MKNILIPILLAVGTWEIGVGQPCHPISQMYNRSIQETHYSYGYDGQTGNARYKDGSFVLAEQVETGIHIAVTAWVNAANGPNFGTAITLTETDYQNAQLKIRFDNLDIHNDGCGTGTNTDIKLNQNWRFDGVGALWSTIIHEMGHAFLGGGHHGNSGIMSCTVGGDCDKKVLSLSPEEVARTLDLYNPPYTVMVKNDFGPATTGQGGSIKVDGFTYHNIPVTGKEFIWRVYESAHTITAVDYQEIPENNDVYVREYQRWRNEVTNNVMAERPDSAFNPPPEPATYIASFLKLFNVTFSEPNYIDGPASGGYYKVEGEPANSTVIRQDESKLIEAILPEGWFFVAWSDNHADKYTNPRWLAPTDHVANLSATFKKHLGSSLATATSTNGQRKLSVDKGEIDSKAALTYASGGEIWLSESDVSLGTFTNEFRVSEGSGNFGFPSVLATSSIGTPPGPGDGFTNSPPHIAVVYQKTFENGLQVYFREKSGETWENPATLESYNFGVVNATPVIGRTGCEHFPKFTVVWVRGEGLKYRHRSSGTWNPSPQGVPGSTSGDVRPSISTGYMNYDPNYHGTAPLFLSYDNGTSVFLQRINGGTFQTRETIWQTTGTFAGKSQVAADTRNPSELHAHVVWENLSAIVGPNEEEEQDIQQQNSVMHRRKVGNTLEWVTEFRSFDTGEHYYHPTVALLEDGTARWAWDNGMDCFKARWDGSSWEVTDYQPYTAHPTLPGNGTSGLLYSAPFLSMSLSGAPYAIEQRDQSDAVPRIETAYSRRVAGAIAPAKGELPAAARKRPGFSIELRQVQLKLADGSRVGMEFVQTRSNQTTAWEMMQTRPVMLTAAIESVFVRGFVQLDSTQRLGGSVRISFDLIDNQTGNLLGKLGTERVFTADTVKGFRIMHRIAPFAGREVIIRPAIAGLNERDMKFEYVHVHTVRVDTNSMRPILPPTLLKQQSAQGPTEFVLHANYPNPFNPATTINFDLPEASHVSLVVFDVLGRKVGEIVNSNYAAGYHSARWNASSVASGMYLARFMATDGSGNVRLNKVSKLVLTK